MLCAYASSAYVEQIGVNTRVKFCSWSRVVAAVSTAELFAVRARRGERLYTKAAQNNSDCDARSAIRPCRGRASGGRASEMTGDLGSEHQRKTEPAIGSR